MKRNHPLCPLLTAVAVSALAVQVAAAPCVNPKASIVDAGTYAAEAGRRNADASTVAGYTTLIEGKTLNAATERVKAKLGDTFGFRYKLACDGPKSFDTPMTIRVLHPMMTNPKSGKSATVTSWDNSAWANHSEPNIHSGFRFDEPWEIVPGDWTIQVVHEGKVLLQKKFIVE